MYLLKEGYFAARECLQVLEGLCHIIFVFIIQVRPELHKGLRDASKAVLTNGNVHKVLLKFASHPSWTKYSLKQ